MNRKNLLSWTKLHFFFLLTLLPASAFAGHGSNLGDYGTHFSPAVLSGQVTSGGAPVANATVSTIAGHSTTTDAAGTYTVHLDAPGIYTVTAESGADRATSTVEVFLGAPATLDLDLGGQLTLSLTTNAANFGPSDTLTVSVGVDNPGIASTVDFLFGAVLPDGDTVVFFTDLAFTTGVGSLANPNTLQPIVAGVDLTTPFAFNQPAFFTFTWAGTEPPGTYILFLAAVQAGALADNSIDAGDIVAVSTAVVDFTP